MKNLLTVKSIATVDLFWTDYTDFQRVR